MPKKALGRGLGELLLGQPQGAPAAHGSSASAQAKAGSDSPVTELGPGLRVLVRDKGPNALSRTPTVAPPPAREGSLVLKATLLGADAALLAVTFLWWMKAGRPLGLGQAAAVIIIVALGAWLGSLAAWLQFRRK